MVRTGSGGSSGVNHLDLGAARCRHPSSEWLRDAPYLVRQEVPNQGSAEAGRFDGSGVPVLPSFYLAVFSISMRQSHGDMGTSPNTI